MPTSSYRPTALDYGVYYWRMRVETTAGWSEWTPAWELTYAPPPPPAPLLTSPTSGAVVANAPLDLTWAAVAGGDTYQVQVDDDKYFRSLDRDVAGDVGVISYTLAACRMADTTGTCAR